MKRFKKCRSARFRKERNETNDCAVIALSILGRMSYGDAHKHMKAVGRKVGGRLHIDDQITAYINAGLVVTVIQDIKQPNGCKYTPKTIGERLQRGYYLCRCHGHVFSVVNGVVEDWTNDRKHHIKEVFKITRPRK